MITMFRKNILITEKMSRSPIKHCDLCKKKKYNFHILRTICLDLAKTVEFEPLCACQLIYHVQLYYVQPFLN